MSTVSEYSAALVLAHKRYHEGITNEAGFTTEIAAAVSNFDNVGTLIERLQDALTLLSMTTMSLKILGVIGVVNLVSDLPAVASNGDAYKVNADGHIWGRIAGAWVDLGAFKGDPGSTVCDLIWSINNPPLANERSPAVEIRATISLNVSRSKARADAAPSDNPYVAQVMRDGSQIGTITWAVGSLTGVIAMTVTTLVLDNRVWIQWPAVGDTTFSGPSITLSGDR